MVTPRINSANAREMQQRSVAARKSNRIAREAAEAIARQAVDLTLQSMGKPPSDPYAEALMRAQIMTLDDYIACPIAKDRAALAQALKNLRETYHLATGLAKPGVRKPERQSRGPQTVQTTEPEPLPPAE